MKKTGFTFIELIIVMAIVAILSVCGADLMAHLIQNSVFIPNKLNMDMLAMEALDIMIEGNSQAKGLRFSTSMTNIQDNQVTFNNQDNQSICYRLDTLTNMLYRSINAGPESLIPYYATAGVSLTGKNSKLFTYYDTNEVETTNPVNVRRIKVDIVAKTGSGSFSDWEGRSDQSSSIAVKKYN